MAFSLTPRASCATLRTLSNHQPEVPVFDEHSDDVVPPTPHPTPWREASCPNCGGCDIDFRDLRGMEATPHDVIHIPRWRWTCLSCATWGEGLSTKATS